MENKIENSLDYINKKTGTKSGFSVPSNYFENFEESFNIKLKEEKFVKKQGFEVPASYFDNLEENIFVKIVPVKKEVKVISFKQRVLNLLPIAAAASIALFIGLNSFVFNNPNNDPFNNLADVEVENWISNNINSIYENDEALTFTDIEFDDFETIPNSITNDELEDYLNNQENISLILEND